MSNITDLGILVDTSFGASQAADGWTGTSTGDLSARIAEGVFAVNVTEPPADLKAAWRIRQPAVDLPIEPRAVHARLSAPK